MTVLAKKNEKVKNSTLSIIVPCFNEKNTIVELIGKIVRADCLGLDKEIIIVDDFSTDGTRKLLSRYMNKKNFKVLFHKKNIGKGGALKTGFQASTGSFVLIQDADLEYDPQDYPVLLHPILSGRADVVYGSRFMGGREHRVVYFWHSVMNRFLTTLSNMFTNINLTDMETCYKVFKGPLIRSLSTQLKSNRFGFEPEITARLSKVDNISIYEVGVSYYGRTYAEGKHIGWKDGLRAVWEVFKYNVLE